jgi:hypothetical protein
MKQLDLFEDSEIWKAIDGFDSIFQVSTHGRLRSTTRTINAKNGKIKILKGKLMASGIKNNGYYMACICYNYKIMNFTIHRLMALAFIPRIEGKDFVNHIDGNRANNNLSNLEWVTRKENVRHGVERAMNEGRIFMKYTKIQIIEIRDKHKNGHKQTELAIEYKTKPKTIADIIHRRTWDFNGI